jgi:hypothetical protein
MAAVTQTHRNCNDFVCSKREARDASDASPPPPPKPGLRGRIIAKKKAELTDHMQSAVSLVKSYLPPDPAKIQATQMPAK